MALTSQESRVDQGLELRWVKREDRAERRLAHSWEEGMQEGPWVETHLDGRVPLPRGGRPAHVVVEVSGFRELILLLWHLDSCILCLF